MKKCFLCNKTKNVLNFNNSSFEKCSSMLMFRRKKKFKYGDIVLTLECTDDFGYHSQCLKKITVLKMKHKQEFEDFCKTLSISSLPSNLNEQSTCPISSDVKEPSQTRNKKLPCFFCGCIEKKIGIRRSYVVFPRSEATVQRLKATAEILNDNGLLQRLENRKPIAYHTNCIAIYKMSQKRQLEKFQFQHIDIKIENCMSLAEFEGNIEHEGAEDLKDNILKEMSFNLIDNIRQQKWKRRNSL